MFIPDDESGSKSYHLSKNAIRTGFLIGVLLIISVLGILFYYAPKLADYSEIKNRHDQLVAERLKVLELTRDLGRLKQMDALIRHSLGSKLDFDDRPVVLDSITGVLSSPGNQVSFIENITSVAPIQGYVSQRSGKAGLFIKKTHHGIDIVAKEGEPILAAASGVIVYSGWNYEFGNMLILYHGNDYFTHYGHNLQNFKKQLDIVTRGEVIGLVGNTGVSSGPHLHFEVWREFLAIDPLIYFPEYREMDLTSLDE
jgi:murein DD-endopeptidase MepM/ murein hydrolase activator NlpD